MFQAEAEVISKLFTDSASALHPLTIVPLVGQILLVITLFQKNPGRKVTYVGTGCLATLPGVMLAVGCLSLNYKIISSTIPFLIVALLTIRHPRKMNAT